MSHSLRTTAPQGPRPARTSTRLWLNVDVPQPPPDVVHLPPSPHPVPLPPLQPPALPPSLPPEITDPPLPGQQEPVREPPVSSASLHRSRLHQSLH